MLLYNDSNFGPVWALFPPPDSMFCSACDGLCDKVCEGKDIDSLDAAQSLKDCTVINGSLRITIRRGSK